MQFKHHILNNIGQCVSIYIHTPPQYPHVLVQYPRLLLSHSFSLTHNIPPLRLNIKRLHHHQMPPASVPPHVCTAHVADIMHTHIAPTGAPSRSDAAPINNPRLRAVQQYLTKQRQRDARRKVGALTSTTCSTSISTPTLNFERPRQVLQDLPITVLQEMARGLKRRAAHIADMETHEYKVGCMH